MSSFILGGNAVNIPMPDSSFNNIFLHDSIQHFDKDDDYKFFYEAHRLLKKGGKLFIAPIYLLPQNTVFVDPKYSNNKLSFNHNFKKIYLKNYNNTFGRNFSPNDFFNRL